MALQELLLWIAQEIKLVVFFNTKIICGLFYVSWKTKVQISVAREGKCLEGVQ